MTATSCLRCSPALRRFLLDIPREHEGVAVRVEIQDADAEGLVHTVVTLASPDLRKRCWRLPRPAHEVTAEDLAPIRESLVSRSWFVARLGRALQFSGLWLGFTSFFAMGTTCPCCGGLACAMGIGSAGTLGAAAALVFSKFKSLSRRPQTENAEPSRRNPAGVRRTSGASIPTPPSEEADNSLVVVDVDQLGRR